MPQEMRFFYMSSNVKRLIKAVNKHYSLYLQLDKRADGTTGIKKTDPFSHGNNTSMERIFIPPTYDKTGAVGDSNARYEDLRDSGYYPEKQMKKEVINVFHGKKFFSVKYKYDPLTGIFFSPVLNERLSLLAKNKRFLGNFLYFTLIEIGDVKGPNPGHAFPVEGNLLAKAMSMIVTGAKEGCEYYYLPGGPGLILHTCKNRASFLRSIYKILNHIKFYHLIVAKGLQPAHFTCISTLVGKNDSLDSVLNRAFQAKPQNKQYGSNCCIFIDSKGNIVKL
ncbi:hypothetical protein ACQK5W_08155 [Pantoea sp. FN060301]|uniref:hypothetical protein n=1 Tax=Pantoea sp. FN060301 TaxID=3420380 RepID=UPI003D1783FA